MADYKELLRRAIAALPENNGSARRAVYDKARSALVGQLRAIQPPLPAREITQHRLQLEDCIRQVEQEASEAVIQLGREAAFGARPAEAAFSRSGWNTPSVQAAAPAPESDTVADNAPGDVTDSEPEAEVPEPVLVAEAPRQAAEPPTPEPEQPAEAPATDNKLSIEEIIAKAAETSGAEITPVVPKPQGTPAPTLTPRGESGASNVRPFEPPARAPASETRREPTPLAASRSSSDPVRFGPRTEPTVQHAVARQAGSPLAMAE